MARKKNDGGAAWHSDPTGRHQYRYWGGAEWTSSVSDAGVVTDDPPVMELPDAAPEGEAVSEDVAVSADDATTEQEESSASTDSETPAVPTPSPEVGVGASGNSDQDPAAADDAIGPEEETSPVQPVEADAWAATAVTGASVELAPRGIANRRTTLPTWVLVGVGLLFLGTIFGLVVQQANLSDKDSQISALKHRSSKLSGKVNDRAAQQKADAAKAARLDAEKQAAADQAAKDAQQQAAAAAQRQAAADAAAAAAETAKNTIAGNGTFAIGSDKNPGRYEMPTPGGSCYWAILSSPSGGVGTIIDNDNTTGPAIVELSAGQYFQTSRCATWTRTR